MVALCEEGFKDEKLLAASQLVADDNEIVSVFEYPAPEQYPPKKKPDVDYHLPAPQIR